MPADVGHAPTAFSTGKDNLFSSLESRHCAVGTPSTSGVVKWSFPKEKLVLDDGEGVGSTHLRRIEQLGREFSGVGRGFLASEMFTNIGSGAAFQLPPVAE